ncbi:LytTR family transcriptional regulator [Spirosoma taeanense]|uniref:LytTR family transcriptional regulator n=1 Tax=Spirosoma taeanense TaxID=2735870 RepID=A0A6M5Y6M9_9BACT|nr:LytTR family DNA-binding domain-containing protein [Spirosoma taeanense]QJW89525.1 LytTR family transcriptional regulator [Spirosoma taeanense]
MEATLFPAQPLSVSPQFPASYQRGTSRIALPYLNRTIFISVDDVLCLQGEGNYTFLYTRDRKRYLVSKTLKEFEKTLDSTLFLRIHKSYIINLAYVQRGVYNKERQVRLADGREVAISRRRMKDISCQLAQYWQGLYN